MSAQAQTLADHGSLPQGPGAWSTHPSERMSRTSLGDNRLDFEMDPENRKDIYGNGKASVVVVYTWIAKGRVVSLNPCVRFIDHS